jgi:hypothetical protein
LQSFGTSCGCGGTRWCRNISDKLWIAVCDVIGNAEQRALASATFEDTF